jgi:hypothetical protein
VIRPSSESPGEVTLGEGVPIVPPANASSSGGIAKTVFAPMSSPPMTRPDEGGEEAEAEDDADEDEGSGTGRLVMIFVGVMVLLGGLWFAWTTFGKKG